MIELLRIAGIFVAIVALFGFVIAMWEAALQRADGHPNDTRANEIHHLYLGLLLILLTAPLGGWRWVLALLVGATVMADDAYEHLRQLVEPAFQSPLHRLFGATLWRFAWIRAVAAFLNRLFGKAPA